MKSVLVLLVLALSTGFGVQDSQPAVYSQQGHDSQKDAAATTKNKPASKSDDNREEKKSAKIETFITYAQSVPAEFSADLLIQLAESREIKERAKRRDLLVEAFYAAAKAKQSLKLAPLPGSAVDSRLGYRANAF